MPIVFGTVQRARNFGHWKEYQYHFRSRISTCTYGTVRAMTTLLNLSDHGAKREEVSFFVSELQCDTQQATRPKGFETIGNHVFPGYMVLKHANLLDRKCLDGVSISIWLCKYFWGLRNRKRGFAWE